MAAGRYIHRIDIDDQHALHIFRGSIVEVEADALVSSDDNYLSAGGGVSAALARVAGNDVYLERRQLAQAGGMRLGDVVRTSAGPPVPVAGAQAVTGGGGNDLAEKTKPWRVSHQIDRIRACPTRRLACLP